MKKTTLLSLALIVCIGAAAAAVYAQSGFGGRRAAQNYDGINIGYDGKLAFFRIRYATGLGGFGRRGGNREPPWAHDYPTADQHMMRIISQLTTVGPHVTGSNIYSLDDPDMMNHPIAYLSEPGQWTMNEDEVKGLRSYLLKGGFLIVDDFRGNDWWNLEEQMKLVLPELRFVQLDTSHPIFNSFFEIKNLEMLGFYSEYGAPSYWGLFEDNDPTKRLIAIANRNNDLGEYWEYSDTGFVPIDLSNEAYKFGVNYFIYGLTR
jgi:hypothetical protein